MRSFAVSVMRQKRLRSVGLRSTSVRAEQRFTEPLAPLVKCVAVWVLMLKHIQAPHTDALKTHFTQIFSAALLECEKSGSEKSSPVFLIKEEGQLLVAGLFRIPALHRNYFVWSGYKGASIRHAFCACRYFCVFVVAKAPTEHKVIPMLATH